MIAEIIISKMSLEYENKILLVDIDNLFINSEAITIAVKMGFEIYEYNDPLDFRYYYEKHLRGNKDRKLIVHIRDNEKFIPYDIRKSFYFNVLDYSIMFPKIFTSSLRKMKNIDLELLNIAYHNYYGAQMSQNQTEDFLKEELYSKENLQEYYKYLAQQIRSSLESVKSYKDWFRIANLWAKIQQLNNSRRISINLDKMRDELNTLFHDWMMSEFKTLSGNSIAQGPVIVSKINDYMRNKSKKVALIVVDGMSVENWLTIVEKADSFDYDINLGYVYAIVPTITSISRKTIFSGMLPINHSNLFSLSDEGKLWKNYWISNGVSSKDIFFGRGTDVDIPYNIRIAGIILNTVDDLMHGESLGSEEMHKDVSLWSQKGELKALLDKLIQRGFDIFITADHGNISGVGIGKHKNEGLLTEVTSQRARVYQDFANTENIQEREGVFKYPGFYMPKQYQYYICDKNYAFEQGGKITVCHGGMSIEEVIVPFVQIKEL